MKDYKVGTFLMDLILGAITGGIWWIYRLIKLVLACSGKNKD